MSSASDGLSVLVVNAGSSSIKLRLLGPDDEVLATTDLHADRHGFDEDELREFLHGDRPGVVGHRVVHGGTRFTDPTRRRRRGGRRAPAPRRAGAAAPAGGPRRHRGRARRPARRPVGRVLRHVVPHDVAPGRVHVRAAREWLRRWPIRRYGFHGLSHAYASRHVAELARADGLDVDPDQAAHGGLPPGRGRVALRGQGRPIGRHDDGLHPARGAGDGDALRLGRPRPGAVAAARRPAVARRPRGGPGARGRPARPRRQQGPARPAVRRRRRPARRLRWPSTSTCTGSRARSRR